MRHLVNNAKPCKNLLLSLKDYLFFKSNFTNLCLLADVICRLTPYVVDRLNKQNGV